MLVTSFTRRRRSATIGAAVLAGVVLAAVAGFVTYFGLSEERIRHYAVDVAVQEDGSALVRETIDYDFGNNSRHGILRDFPGYGVPGGTSDEVLSDVRVRSASAPAGFELTDDVSAVIRVGDPDTEISGLHRYVLEYRVTGATDGDRFGFDMIGTGWDVPVDEADLRITGPRRLTDVGCHRGSASSETPCETFRRDGDALTAHVTGLDEAQGVTIDGTMAGALAGPVRTALPDDVDLTEGRSYWTVIWRVLGIGGAAYLLGIVPPLLWARRRGRDRAWAGGGVDAVFGGPGMAAAPIADTAAERQVTMQFEPPRDLTPAQGGVLLHEKVEKHHQVAWLTQQSIDGWFAIEGDGKRLRWTAGDDRWASAPVPLRKMFNRRAKVKLGKYDRWFAEGFRLVADELKHWRSTCELWDHAAEKRNRRVAWWVAALAVVAVLAGVVALFLTGRFLDVAYLAAGVSGFLAGAGVSMVLNADELPIRTPAGFARRQLVEGFRRFLAASEGRHARAAAERGELRLYSAWAVALGELDRWNKAMAAAALPPATSGVAETAAYVALSSTVDTATSAPSTSGSSGGGYSGGGYSGGGDVGGGGGGGGGGSW
ncbi:DUF2207 domain-containing protein [Actinophytocola sp. KF-1]